MIEAGAVFTIDIAVGVIIDSVIADFNDCAIACLDAIGIQTIDQTIVIIVISIVANFSGAVFAAKTIGIHTVNPTVIIVVLSIGTIFDKNKFAVVVTQIFFAVVTVVTFFPLFNFPVSTYQFLINYSIFTAAAGKLNEEEKNKIIRQFHGIA
jgi:hypothetical protein